MHFNYGCNDSGLSPRLRGNLYRLKRTFQPVRSIPALAGEPVPGVALRSSHSVYPRACGGTCRRSSRMQLPMGLSPRLRGNLLGVVKVMSLDGSIPALAGEPICSWVSLPSSRVYPRACGGTPGQPPVVPEPEGLSPRLRGNPNHLRLSPSRTWSIPALAGEPSAGCRSRDPRKVYPRACGGTTVANLKELKTEGLSPRLRGNRSEAPVGETTDRSIPALAGEPALR